MQQQCPVCLRKAESGAVEKHGAYTLRRCPECEVVFSDPMRIPDGYYDHHREPFGWKWEFDAFLELPSRPGERLLDVGCGDGMLLGMAGKRGYHVQGVDASGEAVDLCRKNGIRNVWRGPLDRFVLRQESKFDTVTCFHTLEHVPDPPGFIQLLRRFLRKGGRLVIGVPNAHRFTTRIRREVMDYPPHHLTRWSSKSLQVLLSGQALRVQKIEPETIRLNSLKEVNYALWLTLNCLTQTGIVYRMSKAAQTSVEGNERADSRAIQTARALSSLKGRVTSVARGLIAPVALAVLKGKTLNGPGLLAVAERR